MEREISTWEDDGGVIVSSDYDEKRNVFHRPNVGSIYMGALDPYQMLETFIYELEQQRPLHDDHRRIIKAYRECEYLTNYPALAWVLLYGVSDALNTYAPKGYYFGARKGKTGEYGFYPGTKDVGRSF